MSKSIVRQALELCDDEIQSTNKKTNKKSNFL